MPDKPAKNRKEISMANPKITLDVEFTDNAKAMQLTNEILYHNQEASRAAHELNDLITFKK